MSRRLDVAPAQHAAGPGPGVDALAATLRTLAAQHPKMLLWVFPRPHPNRPCHHRMTEQWRDDAPSQPPLPPTRRASHPMSRHLPIALVQAPAETIDDFADGLRLRMPSPNAAVKDVDRVATARKFGVGGDSGPWGRFRTGDTPLERPLYNGHIDPAIWRPAISTDTPDGCRPAGPAVFQRPAREEQR